MKRLKVGLIGYGFSGETFHAPLLKTLEEFEIRKVMSSNPEKVKSDLGVVEVVEEIEDVLTDPEIELVVITTPNVLHYEMAKQSLLHGKHVVIEKPMVIEVEEAESLIQLAKEQDRMLSIYQNRRWDNDFLTIKKLILDGTLGEINMYEAHFDRFRPKVRNRWREIAGDGSGILYDLGSHLIDQALHLFGKPKFVIADVMTQRDDAETDDYFHIIMGYEKLRVILHSASLVTEQGPKYEIYGSEGSFVKYGIDRQEADLKSGKHPSDKDWGKDDPKWYGTLLLQSGTGQVEKQRIETIPGSYASYYLGVYHHIYNGKPCPVPAKDGLMTMQVIHAAIQSSEESKTVFF